MNLTSYFKLAGLPFFLTLAVGCGSEGGRLDPTVPNPIDPVVEIPMTRGVVYDVKANERLVNTSPDPAKVRVVLALEETSNATHAQVTLLEGFADLFR